MSLTIAADSMDLFCYITSCILIIIGIVGCFLPIIPGPGLAYLGLLCMLPTSNSPSAAMLFTYGCLTVLVTVLDYVVPAWGAKRFNCSKFGTRGCLIGTFLGMFLGPFGLLFGPFCGAFIGELIARKPIEAAALGGLGAFLGFLSGVFIKVLACVVMLVCYIRCL